MNKANKNKLNKIKKYCVEHNLETFEDYVITSRLFWRRREWRFAALVIPEKHIAIVNKRRDKHNLPSGMNLKILLLSSLTPERFRYCE